MKAVLHDLIEHNRTCLITDESGGIGLIRVLPQQGPDKTRELAQILVESLNSSSKFAKYSPVIFDPSTSN